MNRTVSILIPCHNAAPHLAQCIESAIAQQPDEILLLDDGSTDESMAISATYPKVTAWTQDNQGAQTTRNNLFERSRCDWIQYLDADDFLFPGKIAQQLSQLSEGQIGYCDFRIDRGNGTIEDFRMKHTLLESLLLWEFIPQTNALLFPRSALAEVAWDETIEAVHEHKLIFDLLRNGWEFQHNPFIGFEYRQNWRADQINQKLPRRLRAREALLKEMNDLGGRFAVPAQTWKRLELEKNHHATITI